MQEGPSEKRSMTESCTPQESSIILLPDTSSFAQTSSGGKCKRRERDDIDITNHNKSENANESPPQKRECIVRDVDIVSIVDKDGGLQSTLCVDELIHVMHKADLFTKRSILCGILVATLREDCLQHFVQSGGVAILDEWLQDGHKVGKSGVSRDGDKAIVEAMVAILHALEKLPINLETLKGCSVGKSVNHLRSHKNVEIQKKARKLVDTWKKRVDLEMKQSNTSSGTLDNGLKSDSMIDNGHKGDSMVDNGHKRDSIVDNAHKGDSIASLAYATPVKISEATFDVETLDKGHKGDSMSSSVDVNLAKASEITEVTMRIDESSSLVTCPEEGNSTQVAEAFSSTTVNSFPSQSLKAMKLTEKSATSSEKDGNNNNNNNAPLCSTSTTSVSLRSPNEGETEDNNIKDETNVDSKNDISNDKREGKDAKSGESDINTNDPNGMSSSPKAINVKEKANEYRKKLRSSGSRVVPSSNDSHGVASHEASSRNVTDLKVSGFKEKNPSIDVGISSSQCINIKESLTRKSHEKVENMAHDSPSRRSIDTADRDDNVFLNSRKPDSLKATPISSCSKSSIAMGDGGKVKGNDAKDIRRCPEADIVSSAQEKQPCPCNNSSKEVKDNLSGNDKQKHEVNHGLPKVNSLPSISEKREERKEPGKDGDLVSKVGNTAVQPFGPESSETSCGEEKDKPFIVNDKKVIKDDELNATHSSCIDSTIRNSTSIHLDGMTSNLIHNFDLNEGLAEDDEYLEDNDIITNDTDTTLDSMSISSSKLTTPVAMIGSSSGAFIPPPSNTLKNCEVGWKGSAATSAFRHISSKSSMMPEQPKQGFVTQARNVNTFDLNNLADQDNVEDCRNDESTCKGLDLNCNMEANIDTTFVSCGKLQMPSVMKQPMLDFDLNEGLIVDEIQEQVTTLNHTSTTGNRLIIGIGSNWPVDMMPISGSTCPLVTTVNMDGRLETAHMGSMTYPIHSSITTLTPPQLSSVVYSQTPPMQFSSGFAYDAFPITSDASLRSRESISLGSMRAPFTINLPANDVGSSNNSFFTWGRQEQLVYNNNNSSNINNANNSIIGQGIVNYKNAGVGVREHFVKLDGNPASSAVDGAMHLFHQASVPITSLKRKDPDYRQTWH